MNKQTITSIQFTNYKAFSNFKVGLSDMNILVGPNNSGKSTIISALRLLNIGLRKANSKRPERVYIDESGYGVGFHIDNNEVSISLENVSTDSNGNPSRIDFNLSDKKQLTIIFPNNQDCIFTWFTENCTITSAALFRKEFPIQIQVVPVLGPIEKDETVLTTDTVRLGINSHRASRHFRNYWYRNNEEWDSFSLMLAETWPGMTINRPELIDGVLRMFCSESRMDREIFWAGFGFQIWCQLLTHISRSEKYDVVVIDEPEIYLHPDVQRQLLGLLRDVSRKVIIATHSVEILSEAEPSDVVSIDKTKTTSQRLKDIKSIQKAIDFLGSSHNIMLAQLARTKKILFVENISDFKLTQKIAKRTRFEDLLYNSNVTPFESGGFQNWKKIESFAWGIDKTIEDKLSIAVVFDRDYFCEEEIKSIEEKLVESGITVYFHKCKEIENYLVNPVAIHNACSKENDSIIFDEIQKIVFAACPMSQDR